VIVVGPGRLRAATRDPAVRDGALTATPEPNATSRRPKCGTARPTGTAQLPNATELHPPAAEEVRPATGHEQRQQERDDDR